MQRAGRANDAEVVVLNTCTVTASADQDARAAIRRVHRENPGAQILVTGCYAQRAPQELAAIPGVNVVVGNSHKHQLGQFVPLTRLAVGTSARPETEDCHHEHSEGSAFPGAESNVIVGDIFAHTELTAAPVFAGDSFEKTRPNLKVQDGCNNRCSFCIIPYV